MVAATLPRMAKALSVSAVLELPVALIGNC